MQNSPSDTFSEYVVQQSLRGMTNQQKVALAQGIRSKEGSMQMGRENVGHALRIFLGIHPEFVGQITITNHLIKNIAGRLTNAILAEGAMLSTATAIGRHGALFTDGPAMELC